MGKFKDLSGQRFGSLTAVSRQPPLKDGRAVKWNCKCDCGNLVKVRGSDLTSGHTTSCGCKKRQRKPVRVGEFRLHGIWANTKQRCLNPNKKDYPYYGGRGIGMCEEWANDFWTFYRWATAHGYRDGLTLERLNCNGDYTPDNCAWIPAYKQQTNTRANRTFTIAGKRFTLAELCRFYGQPVSTVEYRLGRGAGIQEALNKNRRYGVDTKLLELSDKLKALKEDKYEKEAELKELNGEIDGVISEMIQLMTDEELTNFSRNGTNFSLVVQEYPAPEPELKGELYERMKEQGYEHLFTINSQTLQATVKELIANNDGVLPDWLDGLIKIGEKSTIRLTKNKKY